MELRIELELGLGLGLGFSTFRVKLCRLCFIGATYFKTFDRNHYTYYRRCNDFYIVVRFSRGCYSVGCYVDVTA